MALKIAFYFHKIEKYQENTKKKVSRLFWWKVKVNKNKENFGWNKTDNDIKRQSFRFPPLTTTTTILPRYILQYKVPDPQHPL